MNAECSGHQGAFFLWLPAGVTISLSISSEMVVVSNIHIDSLLAIIRQFNVENTILHMKPNAMGIGQAPHLQAGSFVPAGWFPLQAGSPILLKTLEIK